MSSISPNSPHRNSWYFTKQELANTPSIQQGMPHGQERNERIRASNFIEHVGHNLRVGPVIIAVAQTIMHRFYMRNSFQKNHCYETSAACIFLACKLENDYRRLKDVVIVCWRRAMKKDNNSMIPESDKEFVKWRATIIFFEQFILDQLCFDLDIPHPFSLIDEFCQELTIDVKNMASQICSESYVSTLCLSYQTHVIAVACIVLACQVSKIEMEDEEEGALSIWDMGDVDKETVAIVMGRISQVSQTVQGKSLGKVTPPGMVVK